VAANQWTGGKLKILSIPLYRSFFPSIKDAANKWGFVAQSLGLEWKPELSNVDDRFYSSSKHQNGGG
jgi:hypothetical protein